MNDARNPYGEADSLQREARFPKLAIGAPSNADTWGDDWPTVARSD